MFLRISYSITRISLSIENILLLKLNRIISVYALVTEVAKRVPLSDVGSTACALLKCDPTLAQSLSQPSKVS